MIFVSARIVIDPQHVDAYIAAAKTVVEPTRAEKGCNLYAFSRDGVESNVLWFSEEWQSEEDLFAHFETPHIIDFLEQVSAFNVLSMDARKYVVSSVGPIELSTD